MSNTELEQSVLDGSIWDDFCDALKEAGKVVQSDGAPSDVFNKAEGYRYLTRLLRAGLESCMEYGDRAFPELRSNCHETIKMGADNPDNYYQSAAIDPQYDYRIVGDRGSVDYLGFSTVINRYSSGGTMETTGFLDSREMELAADGSLEVVLSKRPQPGNWLKLTDETNSVNVRQTFQDISTERRAELRIERINTEGDTPEPFSAKKLAHGLRGATRFVKGTSQLFQGWAENLVDTTNQLPPSDQAYCQMLGGDPNIFYFHSAWELADDEVLVLHAATIPECQTWNFQLDNWWMESLDYRYHRIHFNKHTANYNADGSVTLVIAERDPGHANWIETAGHHNGSMCWRWIGADQHPSVDAKVVKQSELAALFAEQVKA